MNRWTVRTHQSHRNGSRNPKRRWVVDPPGFDYKKRAEHTGKWHRAGGKWFQWGGERTKREAWKEALDYADRMARTITITLPRTNPPRPTTAKYIVTANHKTDDYHATVLEYVHE